MYVAVCGSVLQCVAVCCRHTHESTITPAKRRISLGPHSSTYRHDAFISVIAMHIPIMI